MENEKIAAALEAAIPGFKTNKGILLSYDESNKLNWFDELLGEEFYCYVEWKEFDSWGLDGLNELVPLKASGITLSIDSLYDEEGMSLDDASADDPYEFFMPEIESQLKDKNLQLLEVFSIENGNIFANENPRFVCVTTVQDKVDNLNLCLKSFGLCLC